MSHPWHPEASCLQPFSLCTLKNFSPRGSKQWETVKDKLWVCVCIQTEIKQSHTSMQQSDMILKPPPPKQLWPSLTYQSMESGPLSGGRSSYGCLLQLAVLCFSSCSRSCWCCFLLGVRCSEVFIRVLCVDVVSKTQNFPAAFLHSTKMIYAIHSYTHSVFRLIFLPMFRAFVASLVSVWVL